MQSLSSAESLTTPETTRYALRIAGIRPFSGEMPVVTYEYKCVSGPTIVAVRNAKVRDQAVKAFEDIMNIEAASGWEFVGIDEFHISEPQGLLSRRRVFVPAKILVFRRAKSASPLATALAHQPAVTVASVDKAPDIELPADKKKPAKPPVTSAD